MTAQQLSREVIKRWHERADQFEAHLEEGGKYNANNANNIYELLRQVKVLATLALDGLEAGELHIVFDSPPSHEGARFIEAETSDGKSINAGEWRKRPDGKWALVIKTLPKAPTAWERDRSEPCPTCGFRIVKKELPPIEFDDVTAPTASEGAGRKSPRTEETQQVQGENTPKGNHPSEDPSPDLDVDGLVKLAEDAMNDWERTAGRDPDMSVDAQGAGDDLMSIVARELVPALQTLGTNLALSESLCHGYTDEIANLEAERDKLKEEVDAWRETANTLDDEREETSDALLRACKAALSAEAERDSLRKDLEEIANREVRAGSLWAEATQKIARTALKGSG